MIFLHLFIFVDIFTCYIICSIITCFTNKYQKLKSRCCTKIFFPKLFAKLCANHARWLESEVRWKSFIPTQKLLTFTTFQSAQSYLTHKNVLTIFLSIKCTFNVRVTNILIPKIFAYISKKKGKACISLKTYSSRLIYL